MDPPIIPRFNVNERLLEIESARKPSKSTLKDVRCEIRLNGGKEEHVFSPGEVIEGQFMIFKTKGNKKIKDIYFNDVEIKFENRFHSVFGKDATFFSMVDNPTMSDLPAFALNPDKHAFESCSFPFSFTIPHHHLEDTCVNGIPMHGELIPPYGSPQICGETFHPTEVAGIKPAKTLPMSKMKDLTFNKFANSYSITCKVKQNIRGLDKPYVVFGRSLEIKVKCDFIPLPMNISQTTLDIGSYYNVGDVNASNDLSISKSTGLKSSDNDSPTGSITVTSLLPSPIDSSSTTTSFPVDFKYIPNSQDQLLPSITATLELCQYTVQSTACIQPQTNFGSLPLNGNLDFRMMKNALNTTVIQKVQTIYKEVNTSLTVDQEWIPDYNDINAYVKHAHITIPELVKDDMITSTFHSCHLQNIYCLHVKLAFEQTDPSMVDDEANVADQTKSRQSSLGSLMLGMKRTSSNDSNVSARANDNSVNGRNTVSMTIPVIVI